MNKKFLEEINSNKYKLFIFDCDGTLIDSMPMWGNIDFEYAKLNNFTITSDISDIMNHLSMGQCAEYYITHFGLDKTVDEVLEEFSFLAAEGYRTKCPEKPGAKLFVDFLKARGIKTALVTSNTLSIVKPGLERLGMWESLDFKVSCEDLHTSKHEPLAFNTACEYFGLKPEDCMVVEDAFYAAETAKNAGYNVIGIYDTELTAEETEKLKKLSDYYISDYKELIC